MDYIKSIQSFFVVKVHCILENGPFFDIILMPLSMFWRKWKHRTPFYTENEKYKKKKKKKYPRNALTVFERCTHGYQKSEISLIFSGLNKNVEK